MNDQYSLMNVQAFDLGKMMAEMGLGRTVEDGISLLWPGVLEKIVWGVVSVEEDRIKKRLSDLLRK